MPVARKTLSPAPLIKLDREATELLQKTAVDLLAGNFCTADEAKKADEAGLTCLQLSEFKQRMHEVLQDGKVTPFEAPILFSVLDKSKRDANGVIHESGVDIQELGKATDALRHTGETIFASGPIREEGLNSFAQQGIDLLSEKIATFEWMHAYLWENEQSYWNFISAENMLGISYLMFGQTLSSFEVEGIERTLETLTALRRDVKDLKRQVEQKRLDPESPAFQRLWNHPLGECLMLEWWYGNHPIKGEPDSFRAQKGYIRFSVWIAEEAYQNLATRSAVTFRKGLQQSLSGLRNELSIDQTAELYAMLPQFDGAAIEFLDNGFTKFANAVASLDSLVLMASGSLLAKLFVSTATGAAVVGNTLTKLGPARHILPGTGLIETGGFRGMAALGVATLNVGAEFGKAYACIESVRYWAGDEAANTVGKLYLFLGSFVGTVGNELEAWYARAIAAKSPEIDAMLLSGTAPKKIAEIAAPHMGEKPFRLTKGMDPTELTKKLERRTKRLKTNAKAAAEKNAKEVHAQTLAEKAAEHQAQIHTALQELDALGATHPTIVTEKILTRARELANAALPAHRRLKNLRNLVDGLRGQIAGAERKAANSLPPPAVGGNGNGGSVRKVESRDVRKEAYETEKARQSIDETPPPEEISPFEPKEVTPTEGTTSKVSVPDELNSASLATLSKGKVTVAGKVEKIWAEHFKRYPAHKASIVRRVEELCSPKAEGQWKAVKSNPNLLEAHVGKFRMIARKTEIGYEITDFIARKDLPTSFQ